ncbi:hypothetical protein [Nannocystis punicea]|uniref:Uncharacterized protein n=1 Tax=Nannocystis punicea TaxID=2995304 RepID=A0ABY7GXD3_9BACT|nr:hypothetical protein [Nannocystis poenicansa]WAS91577.1 hypothetical protein O0S08_35805 [Nannocystis poenicansa]
MGRASLSRRAPGLLALCLGVSVPAGTRAASLPAIVWDAPAGCPDAEALTAELSRNLDSAAEAAPTESIRVQARPSGEGWRVVVAIDTDGRTQERTLVVASCDAAVRAAAFVIAIAVDPARREPQDVVPAPPAPAAPSEPKPEAVAEPAPEPAKPATALEEVEPRPDAPAAPRSRPRRAVRGLVQVGPAVQVGMLPVQAGLATAAGLAWPRARLTLGYTRWFAAEVRREAEQPYGADFRVHAGQLRGGPVLRAGPLEVPLQAGLELGALQAVGVGGAPNYVRTTLWAAATVGAGLGWAPRALRGFAALGLLAEAAISLRRPQFVFSGDREVRSVGPAAFRGFLLIEARF